MLSSSKSSEVAANFSCQSYPLSAGKNELNYQLPALLECDKLAELTIDTKDCLNLRLICSPLFCLFHHLGPLEFRRRVI